MAAWHALGSQDRQRSLGSAHPSGGSNCSSSVYDTPLYVAAQQGRRDVAELLIAKGADVNAKGKNGFATVAVSYVSLVQRNE